MLGVYLGPSPNHARSVALVLNPRTGHVSPQFHVKFADFFETVQKKSTNLDAPEPEWKYLSGFAVHKEQPNTKSNGPFGGRLAPRRGRMTAPTPAILTQDLTTQQQPILNLDTDDIVPADAESPTPVSTAPPTQPVPAQAPQDSAVRQTHSGRVVTNTPRYDQSIMQGSQGLVAWEVLMDQDESERVPTATSQ